MTTIPAVPKRARKIPSWLYGYLLIMPPLIVMAVLIFFPALQSIIHTFTLQDRGPEGFTLANYQYFFSDRTSIANLLYSIRTTLISVALLFLVGFPISLYLRFSTSRIASAVQVLALFPLFVPGIILAYALIRFLGTHGTLETLLTTVGIEGFRTPYLKPEGAIIGLVWEGIPLTVLILTAGLQQVDNALLESARDVGANNWRVFRSIILPLIMRPVLIVLSLNFLAVFGAYTIPYLLGPAAPEMMGVFMQRTFQQVLAPVAAQTQAVVSFVISAAVGFLYVRTVAQQRAERS